MQVTQAEAQPAPAGKPNILAIFGDDVGVANSAYSSGLMGYRRRLRVTTGG
jgi:hypothetical protein